MQAHAVPPDAPFCYAQEKFQQLVTLLSSPDTLSKEHGEIESMLKVEGFELLRQLMQDYLDLRAAH